MGLEVVSFTIKEVRDKNEYIAAMGRPDVARDQAEMPTWRPRKPNATVAIQTGGSAGGRRPLPKRRPTRNGCWPRRCLKPSQAEAQRDLEVKKAAYAETGEEAAGAGR